MLTSMPTFRSLLYYFFVALMVGATLYGVYLLWERYKPARFDELGSVHGAVELGADEDANKLVKLAFSNLDVTVPLVKGEVDDEVWSTSEEAASYITFDQGTIIYGHNFPRILGSLQRVRVGDVVEVIDAAGEVKKYEVTSTKQVYPEYIDSILPSEDEPLVIYTCVGFLDTKRLVVRAKLVVV
jgi:LPXTG-site transpeptidase (sortase) family protein